MDTSKNPLQKLNKENLLVWLKGLRDSQYSDVGSETTDNIIDWYDNLINDIELFWR